MRTELVAPDVTTIRGRSVENGKKSKAGLLQADIRYRLASKSQHQRSDIFHRNRERAAANGLHLRPHEGGKEVIQPLPLTTVPAFLDRETMMRHAKDIQVVYGALLKIEDLALSGGELGNEILQTILNGMDPDQAELIHKAKNRLHTTARNRNSRADAFISGSEINVIEFNNVNPEGLGFHRGLAETGSGFLKDIGVDLGESRYYDLAEQRYATAAHQGMEMLEREFRSRPESIGKSLKRIGIIYERGIVPDGVADISLINRSEMPELGSFFSTISGGTIEVVHGGPRDVEADKGRMAVDGKPIDILWRNAVDIPKAVRDPESSGLIEVIANPQKYPVLNDETSQIIGSKATLSLLFDKRVRDAIGMTQAEVQAVERSIPFTFIPSPDIYLVHGEERMSSEQYLKKFGKYFVLKPNSGTHGEGVHFGPNGGQSWDEAVERAVQTGRFIAQRFIPYDHIRVPVLELTADGDMHSQEYYRDTNIHKIGPTSRGSHISRIVLPDESGKIKTLNIAAGGGFQPTFSV